MDCGIITSKAVLLMISLIFWAAGAALAYVGAYVIKSYDSFQSFVSDKGTLIPAVIIIVVAAVMFIIGIVGCCATLRESKFGLGFFLIIILIIFLAEVAVLVCGFIFMGRIKGGLQESMTTVFDKYNGENTESKAVDALQFQFECCGVMNYTDWTSRSWYISHNNTFPHSCCKNATASTCTGRPDQPELLNTQGCETKLEGVLQSVLSYAMLVTLGFAIIKFFGMISVCVITCRSRRNEYQQFYA